MATTFCRFLRGLGCNFKMTKSYPFVLHNTSNADGKIQILRLFPKSYTHQHTYFELVYVLKGSATRILPDASIPVCAGDYYIANPLSAHKHVDVQDFEIVSCLFLPEYIDRALVDSSSVSALLSNRLLRFGVPADILIADRVFHDTDGSVRRIVKQMEQEYAACRTGYMEMLRCCLTQVLICAARACEARFPHEAITQVLEYLKLNYSQPLQLESLSQQVGYTPQYLSSLFTKEVGMSIQVFLQRLRVEEACVLLNQTQLSVAEVGAAVGYQDTRHFSKVFRRYQSVSPREYRKETKK